MRRKFKNRQKTSARQGLRILLYVGGICAFVMIAASIFVVSFFKQEQSIADNNPMVVTGVSVYQDTAAVFKGSNTVPVLNVRINVRGTGNRLSLMRITFSARGTTTPVKDVIQNAKLWYTSGDGNFSMNRQSGQTLVAIPENDFSFQVKQLMQEGVNHFWLTYDIGASSIEDLEVDAEMLSATIGTLEYEPDLSAPAGTVRIINNTPWYSTGNSDIASLKSWNSHRDGSGRNPTNFSKSNASYHIQAGHTMKNRLNACLSKIIIEKNGTLRSETSINADLLRVEHGGVYVQQQSVKNNTGLKKLFICNEGFYVHANPGGLPAKENIFEPNSLALFTTVPVQLYSSKVIWGNVAIEAGDDELFLLSGNFRKIVGDLEIRKTGESGSAVISGNDTITISGDLIMNGGSLQLKPSGGTSVLDIERKLFIKNGSFTDVAGSAGKSIIQLGNSYVQKGGTFAFTNSNTIIEVRNKKTLWYNEGGQCRLPDVTLYPQSSLVVKSNTMGEIGSGKTLTVMQEATLFCETAIITGNGNIHVSPDATLATSHPDGIYSDEMKGCVRLHSRKFSSQASYKFTGQTTLQRTGIFETIPEQDHVKNLVIKKDLFSSVIILERDFIYTGKLIKSGGSINKNSFRLEAGDASIAEVKPFHHQKKLMN